MTHPPAGPGDEARKHAARANTAHAHGLTCKCSHSPAAGGGAFALEFPAWEDCAGLPSSGYSY